MDLFPTDFSSYFSNLFVLTDKLLDSKMYQYSFRQEMGKLWVTWRQNSQPC